MVESPKIGVEIHDFAAELFPICRSLTGDGNRKTLRAIQKHLPELKLFEVPTGTKAFDWEVPQEWNIREAYILGPGGEKIADFNECNLSVVGYSIPVSGSFSLDELNQHLYSLPDLPNAIPYVTSYYKPHWGFCLPDRVRKELKPGRYQVVIDSELKPGSLSYGEWILPGESSREVFLSTYICHPSLANNELSGPTVTTFLAKWLKSKKRKWTYRIVFIPETIGSVVYLSKNLKQLKEKVIAGYNVSCVGDERAYSYLPSRQGNTLSDRAALYVLEKIDPHFKRYSFLDRGSDERQYCSPGADLPIASVMRTKYGEYPEYHTSLDDLNLITAQGLEGAFSALQKCIDIIESNEVIQTTVIGEPQLGKRGLYPQLSVKGSAHHVQSMMNLLAYADGTLDLLEIAKIIQADFFELLPIVTRLKAEGLLKVINGTK